MNKQTEEFSRKPNPVLEYFAPLVGEWDTVGTHPAFAAPVRGHSSFEWLEGEALLRWRSTFEASGPTSGPPRGFSVVGGDDSLGIYRMLYSDERGVSRIYETSLESGVWKFWRNAPGFSQRFTAAFSENGNTLTGHGELSRDGTHWESDLDLTFTKIK